MEEYIRLEEEKAHKLGKVYNWETASMVRSDNNLYGAPAIGAAPGTKLIWNLTYLVGSDGDTDYDGYDDGADDDEGDGGGEGDLDLLCDGAAISSVIAGGKVNGAHTVFLGVSINSGPLGCNLYGRRKGIFFLRRTIRADLVGGGWVGSASIEELIVTYRPSSDPPQTDPSLRDLPLKTPLGKAVSSATKSDSTIAEAKAIQMILTGIDNDIYSIVDACPNAMEIWKAIKRLKQGYDRQTRNYDNKRANNVVEARENVRTQEVRIQLSAKQVNWRDDTDDEPEDQELEAHYMYTTKIKEVTPNVADNFGPIFVDESLKKGTQ
nr:hypothetical protein [Tanacetum cinerariifolium]